MNVYISFLPFYIGTYVLGSFGLTTPYNIDFSRRIFIIVVFFSKFINAVFRSNQINFQYTMEIRFTHVSALRAISSKHFDSIFYRDEVKLYYSDH